MFGYVTPLEGELKVKEQAFYKSAYCGLCKTMGKRVCNESRLTLSYDIVFLALVRFLLTEEKLEFVNGKCAVSPFKKKPIMKSNASLEYSAAVGALLAYHNIADDVKDKKGIKRTLSRFLLFSAKRMKKRAALPDLDAFIKNKLDELDALEKSDEVTLDSAAQIFGELLSEIFANGLEGEGKLIAHEIGQHIGRWIYIADAADDYEKDVKRGEFNPLTELAPERIRISLTLELEAVSRAVELITPYDDGIMNIVKNIIYLGLPYRRDKIVKEEK
ncbi:MAG: hypothetical protein IJY94_04320 [Clostridia bacterium]|nr:hypothetical protein [Clostridia bacterium]